MMRYLSYYGMMDNPFGKYVSEDSIYESEDLKEAVSRIEYAVETDGIAMITGEPGTGKTTAVRKYLDELDTELYRLIYLSAGNYKVFDFYHALCHAVDISPERCQHISMYERIQKEFVRLQAEDKVKPVVVIDDAHLLPRRILDEFKIFYDFDFDSRCYVTVIIIGNDGIRRRVRENKYESLRDRIVTNYEMKSLTSDEASEYIRARIAAVGGNPDMFNKQVLNAICHAGRGNARRINTLATNLLMLGYTQKKTEFDVEDVKMARDEMSI